MSNSNEHHHYDNPEFWEKQRFLGNKNQQERFSTTSKLIPSTITSILDVGCGNGAFLEYLERIDTTTFRLMGLERSQVACNMAVCKAQVFSGTLESIPLPDNSFDLVSALEVIEHLPFEVYEASLKEIERVAKDYILISVPYKHLLRIKATCPYCGCQFNPDYHMREFDETAMKTLFNQFVQVVERKVYVDDYWFLPILRQSQRFFSEKWLPHFLCPQCGFHERVLTTNSQRDNSSLKNQRLTRLVKEIIPKEKTSNMDCLPLSKEVTW